MHSCTTTHTHAHTRTRTRAQNVVLWQGSAADKAVIAETEFRRGGAGAGAPPKFDVLLASYEALLRDERVFAGFRWLTVIVDEAHRCVCACVCACVCVCVRMGADRSGVRDEHKHASAT